jgi:hypothetical protein
MASTIILLLILVAVAYGAYVMTDIKTALDDLKAKVNANGDAIQAAIVSFKSLASLIQDSKNDPDEIEALAAQLDEQAASLGQAVVNNTPAASPTAPASAPVAEPASAPANVDPVQPATMDAPATPPMAVDPSATAGTATDSTAGPGA